MKPPWLPIALMLCGLFVFIYVMSLLGHMIKS
jgi:hypothetical protein